MNSGAVTVVCTIVIGGGEGRGGGVLINIAYVTLLSPEELMNSGAVAVVRTIVIGGGEGG